MVSRMETVSTLTTRKAAERLGITVRQMHTLIARGDLEPAGRLDPPTGTYFFNASDIEDYAAEVAS